MVHRRQNGFTIIEVLMFLAISGLLLLGAMIGVSGTINNSRFNDAVNSTTSYIQGQYGAVSSGRNSRDPDVNCTGGNVASPGSSVAGMTDCVLFGRLLEFGINGSTIQTRYIVGSSTVPAGVPNTDTDVIRNSNLHALDRPGLNDNFGIPWSVEVNRMRAGVTDVNYIAIVRSPVSERVLFYSFNAGAGLSTITPAMITTANLNRSVDICLRDAGGVNPRIGFVRIGAGQGQDVIRADLTSAAGNCP